LGFSQVYDFAMQSSGDVDMESAVRHRTTFTLYLPQAKGEATAQIGAGEHLQGDSKGGRQVLVVEDNVEVGSFRPSFCKPPKCGMRPVASEITDDISRIVLQVPIQTCPQHHSARRVPTAKQHRVVEEAFQGTGLSGRDGPCRLQTQECDERPGVDGAIPHISQWVV
jgi:hypothetical protein